MCDLRGNPWWHVIWVTHQAWPPTDQRGDWHTLSELYDRLAKAGTSFESSEKLPDTWQCRVLRKDAVQLPPMAWQYVAYDLLDLASKDRVAGETAIRSIAVSPTFVQMLLSCPMEALQQRVARLKSRSSSLLSFRKELGVGGANTWGKGFWCARINDEPIVEKVADFISAACVEVNQIKLV
jgi:hypothetical protein